MEDLMAKLVTVSDWADAMFGEHRPHQNTVLNWIKHGRIEPLPLKVGRQYFCEPTAQYVDPIAQQIKNRLKRGRKA
jgi:hypothetical protein